MKSPLGRVGRDRPTQTGALCAFNFESHTHNNEVIVDYRVLWVGRFGDRAQCQRED